MLTPNLLREARVPQLKDHPERLTITLEQGTVLCTPTRRENSMMFCYCDNGDCTVTIALTERVLVREDDGMLHVTHFAEPLPPEVVSRPWLLYINHQLASEWPAIGESGGERYE